MRQIQAKNQDSAPAGRLALLVGGDLLAMLLIIWVGRSSHALSATDIGAGLFTAAPFIIAWFAVTPWFGLFRADVSQNWRKLVPRLLLAWLPGCTLALVLRALFLGRPLPGGIIPIFAVVMFGTTTLTMLAWRLSYAWWAKRARPESQADE